MAKAPRKAAPRASRRSSGGRGGASLRFVVTGGAGFIGSNLVAELIRRFPSCHVTIVDNFSSGSYANIVEACERRGVLFTGSVLSTEVGDWLYTAVADPAPPRAFFHLAAVTDTTITDEAMMMDRNAGLWWPHLMRACATDGVPLVYASSAATYGTPPQAARREAFPLEAAGKPNNVYGFSKWVKENLHRAMDVAWRAERGQRPWIVGLRYFNVFGPGEARKGKMASMACQLTRQVLAGGAPRLFEHGEQARDQVHVDDVVDCTLAAAGLENAAGVRSGRVIPGVYNLGSGWATSFRDVGEAVRRGVARARGKPVPAIEYFAMPASVRAFYQDFTLADMATTHAGLGWSPRIDPVASIEAYAEWMARDGA